MTSWDGRHVLVTGAGGFIGSHLVEQLVAAGAQVRALTHYNSRSDPGMLTDVPADVRSAVEIMAGDITDPFLVRRASRKGLWSMKWPVRRIHFLPRPEDLAADGVCFLQRLFVAVGVQECAHGFVAARTMG